jgi:hypothetical protein
MFLAAVAAMPAGALARGPIGTSGGPDVTNIFGCIVFEHENFDGGQFDVPEKTRSRDIGTWNDKISSMACSAGCSMTAYEHNDFGGDWHFWRGNIAYVGDDWNDRISSVTVDCSAAPPPTPPGAGSSDSVLVPQESTGPSPFGSSEPSPEDLGIVPLPPGGTKNFLQKMKP